MLRTAPFILAGVLMATPSRPDACGTVPGIRGMPLGLPAIPLEDLQLVET